MIRRQLRIQAAVADADNVRLRNQGDVQVALQAVDRALPDAGIVQAGVGNRPLLLKKISVVGQVHLAAHSQHQRVALQNLDLGQHLRAGIAAITGDWVTLYSFDEPDRTWIRPYASYNFG